MEQFLSRNSCFCLNFDSNIIYKSVLLTKKEKEKLRCTGKDQQSENCLCSFETIWRSRELGLNTNMKTVLLYMVLKLGE